MRHYAIGLLVAIFGCDPGAQSADSAETSASEIDLRDLLPADSLPVGVTVAPNGKRYVLDQHSGLYEVSDSSATLVWNTSGLTGIELTDAVALDADHFAITAENDGFLLDLPSHTFATYFCYLPSLPAEPASAPISVSQSLQASGIAARQRTESVAFNSDSLQLFAQPQTFRLDTGSVAGSELFVFGQGGGQPIQVVQFADPSFVAGGMVAVSGGRLILGVGSRIYEANLDGGLDLLRQLDTSIDITGMARASSGDLWILDGAAQRLLRIQADL